MHHWLDRKRVWLVSLLGICMLIAVYTGAAQSTEKMSVNRQAKDGVDEPVPECSNKPTNPTGLKMNPSPQPPQWVPFEPIEFLEPGWPVQGYQEFGGGINGGPNIHVLVNNIDADPRLEVLVTSVNAGPLNAWHHDGTVVNGWPIALGTEEGIPAMGRLTNNPWLDVVAVFPVVGIHDMGAFAGDGRTLPGWPIDTYGVKYNPTLAEITGDTTFEIFYPTWDNKLQAFDAAANPLPGWPVDLPLGTDGKCFAPVFADLDGDFDLEIITGCRDNAGPAHLYAFRADGSQLSWSPVQGQYRLENIYSAFPVVGDVDGDFDLEIVIVGTASSGGSNVAVYVFSNTGQLEREIPLLNDTIDFSSTAPALADLDNDSFPEIVVQMHGSIRVIKGDTGLPFPGWPVTYPSAYEGDFLGPVVGDVDGDQKPEIVTVDYYESGAVKKATLRIHESNGKLNKWMGEKVLPLGPSGIPAIADIDLDGRNEIIVMSSIADFTGTTNLAWAFDLRGPTPHGPILWGQMGGNAAHQGVYPVPEL